MSPPASTVYLDHAAAAPLRAEALEAMLPFMTSAWGNPSGSHSLARASRRAVDDARDALAEALGGRPGEVVFTSGGTEADNLAITGTVAAGAAGGEARMLPACCAIEHPAVLEPVRQAGGRVLRAGDDGTLDLGALEDFLQEDAHRLAVFSLMLANNETGIVQPVARAAEQVRAKAPMAIVHTDAVQGLPWMDVASEATGADLISVSAHKVGGPKGVGALLVRAAARGRVAPMIRGGPQERELRAGTQDVAGIVGFAAAVQAAAAERAGGCPERVGLLAAELAAGLVAAIPGASIVGSAMERLPAICNVFIPGVAAEELLVALDGLGVCASAGSACASGALEPSHVLLAMGRLPAEARSHVRFSLGPTTTGDEVGYAIQVVPEAVARLRY